MTASDFVGFFPESIPMPVCYTYPVVSSLYLCDDTIRKNIALGLTEGQVDDRRVLLVAQIA